MSTQKNISISCLNIFAAISNIWVFPGSVSINFFFFSFLFIRHIFLLGHMSSHFCHMLDVVDAVALRVWILLSFLRQCWVVF